MNAIDTFLAVMYRDATQDCRFDALDLSRAITDLGAPFDAGKSRFLSGVNNELYKAIPALVLGAGGRAIGKARVNGPHGVDVMKDAVYSVEGAVSHSFREALEAAVAAEDWQARANEVHAKWLEENPQLKLKEPKATRNRVSNEQLGARLDALEAKLDKLLARN